MKTSKLFAPAYNNPEQVINFVASMLENVSPEQCQAELKMVVGWNGEKLITSTDWHVKYPDPAYSSNDGWEDFYPKKTCIVPPCFCPQHESFNPIKIGYRYFEGGFYKLQNFEDRIKLCFNGLYDPIEFAGAETVIEKTFKEGEKIILSDCDVTTVNSWRYREHHVIIDEKTVYGEFVDGKLSIIKNQKAG